MKFLLFLLIFIVFILIFNFVSAINMAKKGHNKTFEPKKESNISKLFNRKKIDKSKAEDVKFEEIE